MVLTKSENKLGKGDQAPDFNLVGTDNNKHTLQELKGEKATLIIFMCNHCPYVQAKFEELNRIAKDLKEIGVNVIGINSNDSDNYPEDNFENMQAYVNQGKINYLYLHDVTQDTAKAYGAVCTPDPFLFDSNLKLIHHSRIDDLHQTISEFLDKGSIEIKEVPSIGCSIKWR
jgi:peroxiredoxin